MVINATKSVFKLIEIWNLKKSDNPSVLNNHVHVKYISLSSEYIVDSFFIVFFHSSKL